jgi:hypothetical protein
MKVADEIGAVAPHKAAEHAGRAVILASPPDPRAKQ